MKQHITPSQAREITEQQFYSLLPGEIVNRSDWSKFHHRKITIGRLIEYLDIVKMTQINSEGRWLVTHTANHSQYAGDELIDVLWKLTVRDITRYD